MNIGQNVVQNVVTFNRKYQPKYCGCVWVGVHYIEKKPSYIGASSILNCWCVRLASLCQPRSDPVRSNSFDVIPGAHPGEPQVPCFWNWSLGGDLVCMPSPREVSDRSICSCRGLTRVSTAGSTQGSYNRTHPLHEEKFLQKTIRAFWSNYWGVNHGFLSKPTRLKEIFTWCWNLFI